MQSFVMTVYDEPLEMVVRQVNRINRLYPDADIILFYDGVDAYPIKNVIHHENVCHLKTSATTGLWAHEWLRSYLTHTTSPYLLKIDPDTELIKPLENYPVGVAVFGSTRIVEIGTNKLFRIHGGGVGFTRSVAERIVDNRWFESPTYINSPHFRDQEDVMLAHIIQSHRIQCIDHPEFSCGRIHTEQTSIAHK